MIPLYILGAIEIICAGYLIFCRIAKRRRGDFSLALNLTCVIAILILFFAYFMENTQTQIFSKKDVYNEKLCAILYRIDREDKIDDNLKADIWRWNISIVENEKYKDDPWLGIFYDEALGMMPLIDY